MKLNFIIYLSLAIALNVRRFAIGPISTYTESLAHPRIGGLLNTVVAVISLSFLTYTAKYYSDGSGLEHYLGP